MIVLDTSALLYWTLYQSRLTVSAKEALIQADQIVICSISVWEIGLKANDGKLALPLSLRQYVETVKQVANVQIAAVTEELWITSLELNWAHKDPADRIIVALANQLGCPLITSDRQIRAFYPASIW